MWLVNLDDAAADLTDLVDLLATLADDGANHVIGDVDLLSHRPTGRATRASCLRTVRTGVGLGPNMSGVSGMGWHVGGGRSITPSSLSTSKVHWDRGARMCRLRISAILRRATVSLGRHVVGSRVRTAVVVVVALTKVSAGGLRNVWDDSHATCDGSRTAAAGSVGRGSSPAKALVELLQKGATDIVCGDVYSVSNARDDQRTLRRRGEAGVRSVQAGTRSFLDLLDARPTLPNDGADQNMGDQKTQGIGLGVLVGGLRQRLVVEGADNQAKGLCNVVLVEARNQDRIEAAYLCSSINNTADRQNTLNGALLIVTNSALGS